MIAGTGKRTGCYEQESFSARNGGISVKRLRGYEVHYSGMLWRWLQILTHRQEVDIGAAHIVHNLMHLHPLLTEPEHDAGFGEDRGVVPLHGFE